jgi:hypothetical protein
MSVEGHRELIEAMRDVNDAPVTTATELSDELGVSRRTALRKLKAAHADGAVGRLKPSPKTAVWWPTQTPLSDYERERMDREGQEPDAEAVADENDEPKMWSRKELRELADELDVPGSGEIETTRRREIAMSIHRIKVRGEIEAAKLRESWDDNLGYARERSAWKNCVLPALQAARDQHGVPVEADQSGTWRWTA